jgi:hypothetical protein
MNYLDFYILCFTKVFLVYFLLLSQSEILPCWCLTLFHSFMFSFISCMVFNLTQLREMTFDFATLLIQDSWNFLIQSKRKKHILETLFFHDCPSFEISQHWTYSHRSYQYCLKPFQYYLKNCHHLGWTWTLMGSHWVGH